MGVSQDKYREAHFNLGKLKECASAYEVGGQSFHEVRFTLNAFVNSARSVTFAIQKHYRNVFGEEFNTWYKARKTCLKEYEWFVNLRNINQKQGNRLPLFRPTASDLNGNTETITIDYSNDDQQQLIGFSINFSKGDAPGVRIEECPDPKKREQLLINLATKKILKLFEDDPSRFKTNTGLDETFLIIDDSGTEMSVLEFINHAEGYLKKLNILVKDAEKRFKLPGKSWI